MLVFFAGAGIVMQAPASQVVVLGLFGLAFVLGALFVLPIGSADMPVVISLLNACSGLAASAAGFVVQNPLLIIAGALVGASGVILTQMMCASMNPRSPTSWSAPWRRAVVRLRPLVGELSKSSAAWMLKRQR